MSNNSLTSKYFSPAKQTNSNNNNPLQSKSNAPLSTNKPALKQATISSLFKPTNPPTAPSNPNIPNNNNSQLKTKSTLGKSTESLRASADSPLAKFSQKHLKTPTKQPENENTSKKLFPAQDDPEITIEKKRNQNVPANKTSPTSLKASSTTPSLRSSNPPLKTNSTPLKTTSTPLKATSTPLKTTSTPLKSNTSTPLKSKPMATPSPFSKKNESTSTLSSQPTSKLMQKALKNTPATRTDLTSSYQYNLESNAHKKVKNKEEVRRDWLENPRDKNKRTPDDPEYDPTTLFIPLGEFAALSPFEKQYWEIKRDYFDTIIFFKKGKFYELYERDADIGQTQLDLKMTQRVNMRMVGVPESHFFPWAAKLIGMGYKVGRVDQTETQGQKEKREEESQAPKNKKASCLQRNLTKLYTIGTLVDVGLITSDQPNFLMSITEMPSHEEKTIFGVCLLDSSTGAFHFSKIEDNKGCTGLDTLLLQTKPREILYEKEAISKKTTMLIKRRSNSPLLTARSTDQFWKTEETVKFLGELEYFGHESSQWPNAIQEYLSCPNVIHAFGGLICYLKDLMLHDELLKMKKFHSYDALSTQNALVLDGQTLFNLEILENNIDHTEKGSLLSLLNQAVTPAGKRLFKQMLCYPLVKKSGIEERLDAVDDLNNNLDLQTQISLGLSRLPDLERMSSRIYADAASVRDFVLVLESFEKLSKLMLYLVENKNKFKAKLLHDIFDGFPNIQPHVLEFSKRFDMKAAKEDGVIQPFPNAEQDYDQCEETRQEIEQDLNEYKKKIKGILKTNDKLEYRHMGKFPYQLEIPVKHKDKVPKDMYVKSSTKAVNRYYSPEIENMIKRYKRVEVEMNEIRENLLIRQLQRFTQNSDLWNAAITYTAHLDCLMSLAKIARSATGPICRPTIVENQDPFLDIQQMTHPTVANQKGSDFIPNDLKLGNETAHTILLTGPNMGGKSTTLRSACITIIMAQLGSYVYAESCTLTPVDRIFTRIGANDDIMSGQSTFMMELNETSSIMNNATKHSLVILDELGRGTSTFDGYSIAYSVLGYLACSLQCRTLFATHYHKLTDEYASSPFVSLQHMQCIVDEDSEDVTFLYQLAEGVCSKSFGMNVARKAGLGEPIVQRAKEVAKQFEAEYGYSREDRQAIPTEFYQLVALLNSIHLNETEKVQKLKLLQNAILNQGNLDKMEME